MKISQLIKKLQTLQEVHGDNSLSFTVKDYFSRYGEQMEFNLITGDSEDFGTNFFSGMTSVEGSTTLQFSLKPKEGKSPKITYRK